MELELQAEYEYDGAPAPEIAKPKVAEVLLSLFTNPAGVLVRHWNWKSALFSSLIRAFLFGIANMSAGWRAAGGVVLLEFGIRPLVSGGMGALTQAMRFAEPRWQSNLVVMIALPVASHVVEYAAHSLHGTPKLARSITISIIFSILSGLMNLFFMRRGVLVVGEADAASFGADLRRIPRVFLDFLLAGPIALYRLLFESRASGKERNGH